MCDRTGTCTCRSASKQEEFLLRSRVPCVPWILFRGGGVIVFFYRGLLELAKSFLDPWGKDGSEAQNVNIDVLLAEVHKDTPLWANAGQCAPITRKAAWAQGLPKGN